MNDDQSQQLPQAEAGDQIHLAVKAALSAIPVAGGPAAELFAAVIAPPLARRRDRWLQSLADALAELQEKVEGFSVERLAEREEFISAALQASRAAVETHQKEKLEALRDAVLNIALGHSPDEDQQAIFLGYIANLTGWHIRILRFLQAPQQVAAGSGIRIGPTIAGALAPILEQCFPDLHGRRDFYGQIVRDLNNRGFLNSGDDVLHVMMTASGLVAKRTTVLADQFLAFIEAPAELK